MPAGAIHLCVAKSIISRLDVENDKDFYIGNIAPDSWRNSNSTKVGSHFLTSSGSLLCDYEKFYEKYKGLMSNSFVLGYLVHLITDRYWHTHNLLTTVVENEEYGDLNRVCSDLVCRYQIEKLEFNGNLDNPVLELEKDGIKKTVDYLNSVNYLDDYTSKFSADELLLAIEETSEFVGRELVRLNSIGEKNSKI